MSLILIAAVSENNVIGLNGKMPWHIKEDLVRFKGLTLNHPVIMGRKTYESIPKKFRPLTQRKNIVLSRNFKSDEEIYIAQNVGKALDLTEGRDSYVIGGEKTYELFLPFVSRIELTRVHANYEGNSFFPHINWNEWNLTNQERNVGEEGIEYSFLSYNKKM